MRWRTLIFAGNDILLLIGLVMGFVLEGISRRLGSAAKSASEGMSTTVVMGERG